MTKGLLPSVPLDMEDTKGVYLFKSIDDMTNALMNWFGERIEEWEEENDKLWEEIYIKIDLTGLEVHDSVEYEWTCLEAISPQRFLQITKKEKELT